MTYTFVVVDDHEAVLGGTVAALRSEYPDGVSWASSWKINR